MRIANISVNYHVPHVRNLGTQIKTYGKANTNFVNEQKTML